MNENEKPRILIVEDNPTDAKLLNAILKKDYQLDFATNGAQAVKKHANNDYSLILMDIRMPVMNGYDATNKIRAYDVETPIFSITAESIEDSYKKKDFKDSNFQERILKPIKKNEFMDKIKAYLN